ncbi:hypothetical protein [Streptomyces sp. Amel2xC10]|uniref:hypothetical protein n=1 Tax=Streptomyces sp. Amel2xC10 TaxID=1305826 RepID=UPI000A088A01|nr:hypothetical protein [Streptomyces sp. Amel2xC10]SMF13617.1 hypothetical protein SAMN02745830_01746 [Streptomyces sp. Amel2xC10]
MSTASGGVLRLPDAAIPEGCRSWDGEAARRWTGALPSRWVPVRANLAMFVALPLVTVAGAGLLGEYGVLPAWGAALAVLPFVWGVLRPEAARILAPVAVSVVLGLGEASPVLSLALGAALVLVWAASLVRVSARGPQRAAGLVASGGVTAALPSAVAGRLERGTFLFGCGLLLTVAGGALGTVTGIWEDPGDAAGAPAAGWCLAGLGLTVLLAAALTRHRAAGLRGAPVPVLRVLVRESAEVETEVFAADDEAALRPLFTVATQVAPDDKDQDDAQSEDDPFDDERIRPLREAVLFGVPYDGAEVVLLTAAERAGEPPVVEVGVGAVRPVTEWTLRRRSAAARGKARSEARQEERRVAAADQVRRETGTGAVPAGRWRAGWPDWFAGLLALAYATFLAGDTGWWRLISGFGLTLVAALVLPRRLAWRVTADREGLWFNGLRRSRQLPWDEIRTVRTKAGELRVDGEGDFEDWRVHTPRWAWLERRIGLVHPYERTAAEITAMWRDPELRPTDLSDPRRRGPAVWPLGVVIAVLGAAAVLLLP